MTKYTKQQALKIIIDNAKIYDKQLKNIDLLFLYKVGSDINSCMVTFLDSNYLHFTGVITELKAKAFYKKACSNTLTVNNFDFKDEFTTFKKYDILSSALNIAYNAKTIGKFTNKGIKIKADAGVGNVKYTMTIGTQNGNIFYPKGVIDEDTRDVTYNSSPIVSIFSKKIQDKKFDTITYKSKNINIDKLHFPKEIKELLTEKAMLELKPSIKNIELKKELLETEKETSSEQQSIAPAKKSIYAMAMENQKAKKQPTYNKNKNDISL